MAPACDDADTISLVTETNNSANTGCHDVAGEGEEAVYSVCDDEGGAVRDAVTAGVGAGCVGKLRVSTDKLLDRKRTWVETNTLQLVADHHLPASRVISSKGRLWETYLTRRYQKPWVASRFRGS